MPHTGHVRKDLYEAQAPTSAGMMRSVVAASLGLAAGQGARNMFAPVPPGQVYTNQYPTQYVQYDAATQYAYEQPVFTNVYSIQEGLGVVTQALESSFSAVSKPIFATTRSFCSSFQCGQEFAPNSKFEALRIISFFNLVRKLKRK